MKNVGRCLKRLEPTTRLELVTCRLRIGCSTN
jgi:hypothetical protein